MFNESILADVEMLKGRILSDTLGQELQSLRWDTAFIHLKRYYSLILLQESSECVKILLEEGEIVLWHIYRLDWLTIL